MTTTVEADLEISNKKLATQAPLDSIHTSVKPHKLGQHAPSMVDRTGDLKNGEVGPAGPKCNPLKLTPPVNAREYYNSKIPGVRYHKPKTPSWSPSMELNDQTQPTAEQPKSYVSITHTPMSQDWSEGNTTRPTTLTNSTIPTMETTLHTMHTMHFSHQEEDDEEMYMTPWSIIKNTAAAARANLDFVKINGCLSDVLQDIDDIMLQQVSDVFQLLNWLSRVISTFRLKVCNEEEWHIFNRHYNCNTSEITALNQSKTVNSPYDTPMTEVAKDELFRTCEELAIANTTIKNLSKVVVNFSHTGKVPMTDQELTDPMPQHAPKQVPPQETSPPAPHWVKSANPTVIKPTWNEASNPKQPPVETTTKPKANLHCLILQFNPPILETECKNADVAQKEINGLLDTLEVPMYFHMMAVNWSRNSNLIITTMASGTAKDLLVHSKKIGKIFTGNTLILALPDIEYFQAKVNMLSTKDFEGNVQNIAKIHSELMECCGV